MLRKIVVTGDILRPCPVSSKPNQAGNIVWFAKLIQFFISELSPDIEINVLTWNKSSAGFPAEEFYQAEELTPNIHDWAKLYNREELNFRSEKLLTEYFSGAFVVGFELPSVFKNFFNRNNIPYLDFNLHSIRFADDLLLNLEIGVPGLEAALADYFMDPRHFNVLAGLHNATLSRLPMTKLEPGSCLLVGQTEHDKVLIENGRFVTLFDYEEEITELKKTYSKIYYKPHPYCVDRSLKYRLAKKYDFVIVEENIYRYLCNDNIDIFASISSSVVNEARFFGKQSRFFKKGHYFDQRALSVGFLSTNFWKIILQKYFPVIDGKDIALPVLSNRLRKSFGRYWGFNYLDYQIIENELRGESKRKFWHLHYNLPLAWRRKLAAMLRL